jgi:hypothetical protein
MQKNVAGQKIGGQLINIADGEAFTGAVTVYVTGDAGTQAAGSVGSGACTHEGNGYHTYAPAQAETNYDLVAFTFTGTGAVPATVQVFTSFPQTGDAYARLGAPAGASVSADVAAVKAQTAAIETDTQDLQTQVGTDGAGLTAIGDTRLANLDATVSSRLATAGYTAPLDAAGTRTALGMASADLDTQLDAIVADTNELQTDWADGGRLDLLLDAAGGAGTPPTVEEIRAEMDSNSTQLAAIVADTNELQGNQGDWATADVSALATAAALATVDGIVDDILVDTGTTLPGTLATIAGYVDTEVAAILASVDTEVAAIKAKTDNLPASPAAVGSAMTLTSAYDAAKTAASQTSVDDLPTNSELATALASADDATLAAISGLNNLSSAQAQTAAAAALTAYDPPTNAEMVARTLAAAAYFDPAADTVAHVTLVDTTTTNTDMVAAAPSAATIAAAVEVAILDEGDATALLAAIAAKVEDFLINDGDATATLAAIATAVRSELTTELGRIDVAVSSRNATTPPTVAAIRAEMDANSTQLAAIVADTNELQTNQGNWLTANTSGLATSAALAVVDGNVDDILVDTGTTLPGTLATIAGYVDTEVAAIKAKTDNLPAAPAAVGSAMTLTIAYDAAKTAATQTSVDDLPTNAELATALAAADDATLAAISGLNNLSSAQAQTAAAAALTAYDPPTKAELDSGLAGLNDLTAAAIRAEIDSNSTQLAAIVADTNELQTDWADGGRLDLLLDNAGAAGVPPTVEQIRAEIDSNSTQLAAIVEDTGTTIPGQISAIDIPTVSEIDTELTTNHGSGAWASVGLGAGARTVLVTVDDGTDPLEVAKVRLAQGTETYVGDTNASGQITFNVNDATWTVAITKPGYTFAGATLIVDDDKTPTYSMTAVAVSASGPDQSTGYVYCYNEDGEIEEDVVINIQITATAETDGFTFDTVIRTEASDANGLVEVTGLWIGATYRARRWDGDWHSFIVPNAASFALPAMLGR